MGNLNMTNNLLASLHVENVSV